MALDTAFYLVTHAIVQRAGLVGRRYVTKDGRCILDNKDLSRIRFTSEEYVSGLAGVEKIDEETAKRLIVENGYSMRIEPSAEEAVSTEAESTDDGDTDGVTEDSTDSVGDETETEN